MSNFYARGQMKPWPNSYNNILVETKKSKKRRFPKSSPEIENIKPPNTHIRFNYSNDEEEPAVFRKEPEIVKKKSITINNEQQITIKSEKKVLKIENIKPPNTHIRFDHINDDFETIKEEPAGFRKGPEINKNKTITIKNEQGFSKCEPTEPVKKKRRKKKKKAKRKPEPEIEEPTESIVKKKKKKRKSKFTFNNTVNLVSNESVDTSEPVIPNIENIFKTKVRQVEKSDTKNFNHNVTLLQNVIIKKGKRKNTDMHSYLYRPQGQQHKFKYSKILKKSPKNSLRRNYQDVESIMKDVKKIAIGLVNYCTETNKVDMLGKVSQIFDRLNKLSSEGNLGNDKLSLEEINNIIHYEMNRDFDKVSYAVAGKRISCQEINKRPLKKLRMEFEETDEIPTNVNNNLITGIGQGSVLTEVEDPKEPVINLCEEPKDVLVEKPKEIVEDVICISSDEASETDEDSLDEYHKSLDAYYNSTNQEIVSFEKFLVEYNKRKKKRKLERKSVEGQSCEKNLMNIENDGNREDVKEDQSCLDVIEDNNGKEKCCEEDIEESRVWEKLLLPDLGENEIENRISINEDNSLELPQVLETEEGDSKVGSNCKDQFEESRIEDLNVNPIDDSSEVSLNSSDLNFSGSSTLELQIMNWRNIIKSLISAENSESTPTNICEIREIVNKKLEEILRNEDLTEEEEDEVVNDVVNDIFKTVANDMRLVICKKRKVERIRRKLWVKNSEKNSNLFKPSGDKDDSSGILEQNERKKDENPNEENVEIFENVQKDVEINEVEENNLIEEDKQISGEDGKDLIDDEEEKNLSGKDEQYLREEEDEHDVSEADKQNSYEEDEQNLSEEDEQNLSEDEKNLSEDEKNLSEDEKNLSEDEKNLSEDEKNLIEEGENANNLSEEHNNLSEVNLIEDIREDNSIKDEDLSEGTLLEKEINEEQGNFDDFHEDTSSYSSSIEDDKNSDIDKSKDIQEEIEQIVNYTKSENMCKTESDLMNSLTHEIDIKVENQEFEAHDDDDLIEILESVEVIYVDDSEDEQPCSQMSDEVDIYQDETLYNIILTDLILTEENTDLTLNTDVKNEELPVEYLEKFSTMEFVIPMDIAIEVHKKNKCPDCKCKDFNQEFEKIAKTDNPVIEISKGKYTRKEDAMIMANFKDFCKTNDLPLDHRPFVTPFYSHNGKNKRVLSHQNRHIFLLYLSYGIDHRNLEGIFARFKKIVAIIKETKKFSEEENDYIMDRMEELQGNRQALKIIALQLKRSESHVRRHYAYLKMCQKFNRDSKGRRKQFGTVEKLKLIHTLLTHTGVEFVDDLKNLHINNVVWLNIAETMHFAPLYLKAHWLGTLHPQLFVSGTRNIKEIISKFCDLMIKDQVNDYKDINYDKYVMHFDGMTKVALQIHFKREVTSANLLPKFKFNFKGLLLDLQKYYAENDLPAKLIKRFDWMDGIRRK